MKLLARLLSFVALSLCLNIAAADADTQFANLLESGKAPAGVVIEVVSGNKDYLSEVLPRVSDYQKRLRSKFPGLPVAVVSHGMEQFSLTSDQAGKRGKLFKLSEALVNNEDVALHVCGGHARIRGVDTDSFASFVDVADSGPAQIRAYQELGYVLIVM